MTNKTYRLQHFAVQRRPFRLVRPFSSLKGMRFLSQLTLTARYIKMTVYIHTQAQK